MRLTYKLQFDHFERETIARAAVHIRIAYPDPPDRDDRDAWRRYEGRHIMAATERNAELSYEQVHGALSAMSLLVGKLTEESEYDYWYKELHVTGPQPPTADPIVRERLLAHQQGVALIAPNTDPCAVLAEARQQQLHEAQEAREVFARALVTIPPPEPDEKYEEV